jgi:hypothetical protein
VTRLGIAGRVLPMTVVICALGTGCGSPNAPTPTPAPSPRLPPPPGTVAVGTGGRVIDVDSEHPIAGANVTTVSVCYRDSDPATGRCRPIDQPARATADENGVFHLTVSLPSTWNALSLKAAKPGYETLCIKRVSPPPRPWMPCWKSTRR